MPTLERVKAYIARVEQQDYVGALAHFYHDDAVMQENMGDERRGRHALMAHEMDLLVRYGRMPMRRIERFAVQGDLVFINYVFDLDIPGLGRRVLDEIAMQEWDGDRIRRERFYYDPAQIRS
jgi:ketosteroid isomerase-like protein